ncbi:casein kinase 1 [Grosmannia clavigera kw1407]|uniref:non-specific serine/threonine protein kinase n=1 Tax=Grosmannia clavigera (strain kw1407 / UAMH 11150) TaxID=655863 RepID=F0XP96_GROCL|nr:casein kinase 1 [Grosmannia clavigera kw1407]EFX00069.1 casein kinase 1 [Grosmannia clavigera kw1407]
MAMAAAAGWNLGPGAGPRHDDKLTTKTLNALEDLAMIIPKLTCRLEDKEQLEERQRTLLQNGGSIQSTGGLARIQTVHDCGLIYRDIKPDNFLIGIPHTADTATIYLVDFGMAKVYRDPETKEHIPYGEAQSLSGTARYMSINAHCRRSQSRRDDLEAIGHVFMYFLRGNLPWQGVKAPQNDQRYELMCEKKQATSIEDLCGEYPEQFAEYLAYTRGLTFEGDPDYDYLQGLFSQVLSGLGESNDGVYDWLLPKGTTQPTLPVSVAEAQVSAERGPQPDADKTPACSATENPPPSSPPGKRRRSEFVSDLVPPMRIRPKITTFSFYDGDAHSYSRFRNPVRSAATSLVSPAFTDLLDSTLGAINSELEDMSDKMLQGGDWTGMTRVRALFDKLTGAVQREIQRLQHIQRRSSERAASEAQAQTSPSSDSLQQPPAQVIVAKGRGEGEGGMTEDIVVDVEELMLEGQTETRPLPVAEAVPTGLSVGSKDDEIEPRRTTADADPVAAPASPLQPKMGALSLNMGPPLDADDTDNKLEAGDENADDDDSAFALVYRTASGTQKVLRMPGGRKPE